MLKRSQEGLSDDSPSVKAKPRPRAMNLVSHRNLSIPRQSSQSTNDSEFPERNRTEMMLASFGKPSQKSADNLSLHSQERPQGITSRIGSELSDDNVSSHGNEKPLQGQERLEISGQEYECCHDFGKPVRGAQTQEKKTRPEFRNIQVTNTES